MTYYTLGQQNALTKLGMLSGTAGAVCYKPGRDKSNSRGNEKQDLWAEFDQRPDKTYEEKFGSDSTPFPGIGGRDANRGVPHRDQIQSSAMQESFEALNKYDPSFGPEPAMTQPHGSAKLGMTGVSSMGSASPLKPPPLPKINAGAPKPKQPKVIGNAQHRLQNNVHDIDTSMSTGSVGRRMTGSAL